MSIFAGKTLMITGGTGSFGNAVLNRFLRTDIGEIRIFSRDEKKQDDMRHEYQVKYPDVAHKIKFFINFIISFNVTPNFFYPKLRIISPFQSWFQNFPILSMKKLAITKNRNFIFCKHNIRLSRQISIVFSIMNSLFPKCLS